MALTYSKIKSLAPRDKLYKLSDEGGLSIWVYPSGKKRWALAYREDGKQKTAYLGDYPAYSLAEAREWRDHIKMRLARSLPAIEEPEDNQSFLFQNIYEDWFQRWAKTQKSKNNVVGRDRAVKTHLWGYYFNRDVRDIRPSHVVESLRKLESDEAFGQLRAMKSTLSLVFSYATDCGKIDFNPVFAVGKMAFKKAPAQHFEALEPDDLFLLIKKLEDGSLSGVVRLAIYWQLLTMTRPIETVSAKWEDINLDKKQWSISSEIMKKGREHIVPLSSLALSLICEIKLLSNDSPYLFKSNRTASHISRSSLRQGIRRVGLNTTAHGLRALAATTLEEAGYAESAIKAALSHAKDGGDATTAAYLRSTFYDERANMLEYLGEKVRAERDNYLAAIKKQQ